MRPPGWLPRPRPLLRTPERRLSSSEAWRRLRSSPPAAPKLRMSSRQDTLFLKMREEVLRDVVYDEDGKPQVRKEEEAHA